MSIRGLLSSGDTAAPVVCRTVDKLDIFGDSSCKALYRLDGNANDESGNYHGTETGIAVYGGGQYERGVVSSNTDTNFITTANIPSGSMKSISLWINPTALPTDATFHVIYMNTTVTNNTNGLLVRYVSAGLYALEIYINIGGTRYYTTTNPQTAIQLNSWTNIVIRLETNNTISVYKNGTAVVTSTPTTSGAVSYNGSLMLGQYNPNGSNNQYTFRGSIDQVRIFNRAITATEVTTLYAECAPTSIVDNINPFQDGSLKALYQFNGDATDRTGVYNGTATNVTYGTGKFGQCAIFYASSLVSTVTSTVPTFSNVLQFTINMWVKLNVTQANAGQGTVLSQGVVLGTEFFIDTLGGGRMRLTTGGTVRNLTFTSAINDNTWQMLTLTYDGSNIRAYKNANANGVVAATGVTGTLVGDMIIGNRDAYYIQGSIDQVRIFNKALTPMEVAALYNETTPLEEPMHSLVDPFKDGSGKALYRLDGNALDESGNYNGTVTSVTYGNATVGRAAVFNGSTSKINFSTILSSTTNNTDFSMSIRLNFAVLPTATYYQGIIGTSALEVGAMAFIIRYVSAGVFSVDVRRSYSGNIYYAASGLPTINLVTGIYNNISFTYTATTKTVTVYLNGVLVGSSYTLSSSASVVTIQTIQSLGQYNGDGSYNAYAFNGAADQLRIFNRALTAGEVSTLYTEI